MPEHNINQSKFIFPEFQGGRLGYIAKPHDTLGCLGRFMASTGGGTNVALAMVQPVCPIQFCDFRNSPGSLFSPRTPCMRILCISRIKRNDRGSVASRSIPYFITST